MTRVCENGGEYIIIGDGLCMKHHVGDDTFNKKHQKRAGDKSDKQLGADKACPARFVTTT